MDLHTVDVELIAVQSIDRLRQEARVHIASVKRVSVRAHPLDVGREGRGDGVPVVRGEAREVPVDDVAGQRTVEQRAIARVERYVGDRRASGLAHLLGRTREHAGERVGIEPGRDVGELRLEEHEAQRVFEHLHLGVVREVLLAHDRLHAADGRVVVASTREQLAQLARLVLLPCLPPLQVAGASGGRRRTGHSPAPVVVPARRDPQCLRRAGPQVFDPLAHELGVQHFLRPGPCPDGHHVRIVAVTRVDRRDRVVEAVGGRLAVGDYALSTEPA